MSSDAQKRAYKKYNQKKINYAIAYTPVDAVEGRRLKAYLTDTGQSANAYIKTLIQADLDAKGVPYPDDTDGQD